MPLEYIDNTTKIGLLNGEVLFLISDIQNVISNCGLSVLQIKLTVNFGTKNIPILRDALEEIVDEWGTNVLLCDITTYIRNLIDFSGLFTEYKLGAFDRIFYCYTKYDRDTWESEEDSDYDDYDE